jgi:hypothetical protein
MGDAGLGQLQSFTTLDSAFLGMGGTGRVIAAHVSTDVGEIMSVDSLVAAKVSQDEVRMTNELSLLKRHSDSCLCGLLARPLSADIVHKNGLCCYALTPVGKQHVTRDIIAFGSEDMLIRVLFGVIWPTQAYTTAYSWRCQNNCKFDYSARL